MKILLIDDDKDDQEIFCEAVRKISPDIYCELADNGQEALTLLQSYPDREMPELVFLDINMPIMDGRETIGAIRSNLRLRNLQVIMYSTSNNVDEIIWFQQMGAKYITKPSDFDFLVRILSGHLQMYLHVKRTECLI
jgi:CheY-like chemotaxis protein